MHDPNSPQYKFNKLLKTWIESVKNNADNECMIEAGDKKAVYHLASVYLDDARHTELAIVVKRKKLGERIDFTTHDSRYIKAIEDAIGTDALKLSTNSLQVSQADFKKYLIRKFKVEDLRFRFKYKGLWPRNYDAQNNASLMATQNAGAGTGSGTETGTGTDSGTGTGTEIGSGALASGTT